MAVSIVGKAIKEGVDGMEVDRGLPLSSLASRRAYIGVAMV